MILSDSSSSIILIMRDFFTISPIPNGQHKNNTPSLETCYVMFQIGLYRRLEKDVLGLPQVTF